MNKAGAEKRYRKKETRVLEVSHSEHDSLLGGTSVAPVVVGVTQVSPSNRSETAVECLHSRHFNQNNEKKYESHHKKNPTNESHPQGCSLCYLQ